MSSKSISLQYVSVSNSEAYWLGPRGVARDSMHGACEAPYHSSTPAREPNLWM